MYTANKIHVAERDEASLQKTRSGGVSEPSDPSHFPLLSSIDSPRAMSRLKTSFKDRLLTDSGSSSSGQTVENGPEAGPGASWTDRREGGQQDVSPKMLGGRDTDRALEAATSEGRGHVSETRQLGSARPAGGERDSQGEVWEPVSPRRHISQRRRTADAQAEWAAKEGTVYDIPVHANTFGPLQEVDEFGASDTKSPEEMDGQGSDHEGPLPDAGSSGAGVIGGGWDKVEAGVQWVADNPRKTAAVVGLFAVGVMAFMRRRRF